MTAPPTSLRSLFASLLAHRDLCWRLAVREVTQRFKGSMLGLVWAVLTPLLTAAVFTLVFTGIFPQRWPGRSGSPLDFALILLVGMAVHGVLAEALSRAPQIVVGNASYVTKVVFPLEVLPFVTTLAALVNLAITLLIVLLGNLAVNGSLHATALFLPLVLLPYLVFVAAAVTFIAACGVFWAFMRMLRQREQVKELEIQAQTAPLYRQLQSLGDNVPNGFIYQYAVGQDGVGRFKYVSAGIERLDVGGIGQRGLWGFDSIAGRINVAMVLFERCHGHPPYPHRPTA